ncbi:hypothetical protein GCK32_008113 [Trichostrongylus colubriformis]|uniref:Uncharacterized protein n=1 Tax=Trichostrongylus colubriformis TaxID=6319 RepID=A0AAN8IUL4_TRICO
MEAPGPSESPECSATATSEMDQMQERLVKSDVSDSQSSHDLGASTPIRIMSTINPSRESAHQHRLPPGIRVVRGLSTSATTSATRVPTHQVRTVLGTGASHPGRMVGSGSTSPGSSSVLNAPIRTVVGAGSGMRVMQQGGRTLIAVPSGSRLAATLTSVAARAAPVELSTSGSSGPALAVIDVNRSKSNTKLNSAERAADDNMSTSVHTDSDDVHSGNETAGGVMEGIESISSVDGSTASNSPQPNGSVTISPETMTDDKRRSAGGMVTRRMTRGTIPPSTSSDHSMDSLNFADVARVQHPAAPRRRATKRPKYSLVTGDLVRAQYILPSDQLPRRASVPREENPLSITEQARLSRRPIVVHSSGVEFPIPLSLEGHPMKLDDNGPENPKEDILRDDDGIPYCYLCHSVIKTWQGYEYHIMAVHLKYRPYRCMYCMKEFFYTEEEGLSHVRSQHHGKTVTLLREYHDDKDKQLEDAFCALFLAVREGPNFTAERAAAIEKAAYMHLQKFKRMRMKVPEFATRAKSMRDFASQTFATMSSPPMLPSVKFMTEPRQTFEQLQHHLEPLHHPQISMPVDHSNGHQRYVRMSNGELAEIGEQYVIAEDEEGPVGEYIEVDYVDEIIDDGEDQVRDDQEVVVERLSDADDHGMEHPY